MADPINATAFDLLVHDDRLTTAKEIAAVLGVSADTVRRLFKKGDAPIFKPAGRFMASRRDLQEWMRR